MSSSSGRTRKAHMANAANIMPYTNAVYWPNHRYYTGHTPAALNFNCINHVYYAYATVAPDGGVLLSDEWADANAPCDGTRGALGSLLQLRASFPHLQVVLSIGGGGSAETFPVVASSAVLRDNFARSACGLVMASGLDGIDVVWEYPCTPQQGGAFLALLAAIRLHLSDDRFLLTAALPAARSILQNIDLRRSAEYLDFINLTAYDFYGSWTPKTGHQAQLYSVAKDETSGAAGVQQLLAAGVPGKKILMGIPLFGRSFLHATGPNQKNRGSGGLEGSFEYSDLPRRGTKEQVDKRLATAQCVGADGGFVSYDNPDTVKLKASFCKQKGLGGLFYWDAPADAKDSKRSLIATGFRALHGC